MKDFLRALLENIRESKASSYALFKPRATVSSQFYYDPVYHFIEDRISNLEIERLNDRDYSYIVSKLKEGEFDVNIDEIIDFLASYDYLVNYFLPSQTDESGLNKTISRTYVLSFVHGYLSALT